MANDIKVTIVGYLREKYPVEEFGNFRKRECIVRTIKKKKGDYTINDYPIVFWNDHVNLLDPVYPGNEVIVRVKLKGQMYLKDGEYKRYNDKLRPYVVLVGEDIFEKPNGKVASSDIWKLPNGFVEKGRVGQLTNIENSLSLVEEDLEKRFPNDRTYKAENFSFNKPVEDEEQDDLPF